MDFNDLKNTVSNLTLYDLKAGFRKAQNAVMNYTDMESKVREATNNEPWGASSTLMQDIANGTFNYSALNEIMPMIYRRFTEKAAEEWRQIYKALQLLEFLIKNGSERVIDDARGHIALLKMLRQFHYIDSNGKDQGINVRNRAKELAELLSDVDRIRSERKKARSTKNKYTGVEGGAFSGGGGYSGSSSRYGGFGSEDTSSGYGGYSGGVFGDGGGFGGQQGDWQESGASRSDRFEEYDEFDEQDRPARTSRKSERGERTGTKKTVPAPAAPKKKEPEVDLFSFDDSEQPSAATGASFSSGLGGFSNAPATADDDEFDDFQSATPVPQPAQAMPPLGSHITSAASTTAQFAAPQPLSAPQPGLNQMVNMTSPTSTPGPNYSSFASPPPSTAKPAQPTNYQPSGPNYFGGVQAQQNTGGAMSGTSAFSGISSMGGGMSSPNTPSTMANTKPAISSQAKPAAAGGDAFGALWGKASAGIKKTSTPGAGPAMGQLAKEKSSADIWGAPAAPSSAPPMGGNSKPSGGSAFDDLLG